jgi:hypothetical protein
MPSMTFRTRLDEPLSQALIEFARDWGQPVSAIIRDATRYAVMHPDIYAADMLQRYPKAVESANTPEQMAAAVDYLASLKSFSLADIVAEHGPK